MKDKINQTHAGTILVWEVWVGWIPPLFVFNQHKVRSLCRLLQRPLLLIRPHIFSMCQMRTSVLALSLVVAEVAAFGGKPKAKAPVVRRPEGRKR